MRWVDLADGRTMLRYRVDGCTRLIIPEYFGNGRADNLWETTCFELFLGNEGPAYFEFNFSPSGRWAAYGFPQIRDGRQDVELSVQPDIKAEMGDETFVLTAFLASNDLRGTTKAGVSVVIEEEGGNLSYWALDHAGEKPDFHDPSCFAARFGSPLCP